MSNQSKHTISEIVKNGSNILKSHQIENPRLESEILLGSVLFMNRTQIILNYNMLIEPEKLNEFEALISRKSAGEPTAYILGYKEFYGRIFNVNSSVLIPRPETEELVEWILHSQKKPAYILDLCAGSGCIGITLALESNPETLILADFSAHALETAKINARLLDKNLHVQFHVSDLFNNLDVSHLDLVVSNPPYVTEDEFEHLDIGVKNFEPQEALLLHQPGLFNRRLVEGAFRSLKPGGDFYLETNPRFIASLSHFLEISGFGEIEVKKDLSGKDRFIRANKPLRKSGQN